MIDLKWSAAERKIARRAFDAARAGKPEDMWAVEDWLTRTRREIDSKYDYRDSRLAFVFGLLLQEGGLSEGELEGLGPDKLSVIERVASS